MNKSDNIGELAAALAKAQGAMQAAKMDSVNPFLKNRYADLGSVVQAARKPLAENGLSFTQSPAVTEGTVTVTTLLMHSSGQWIESSITLPLDGGKGLSLAQSMGAIITYLRRYSLSAILGIYADEDNDGNQPAKPAAQKAPQAAQESTRSAQTETVSTNAPMTFEDACKVKTSDGKLYSEIDTGTLNNMANSIRRKLDAGGYTGDDKSLAEHKLQAILVILAEHR